VATSNSQSQIEELASLVTEFLAQKSKFWTRYGLKMSEYEIKTGLKKNSTSYHSGGFVYMKIRTGATGHFLK
jgi:hypothetical protein